MAESPSGDNVTPAIAMVGEGVTPVSGVSDGLAAGVFVVPSMLDEPEFPLEISTISSCRSSVRISEVDDDTIGPNGFADRGGERRGEVVPMILHAVVITPPTLHLYRIGEFVI